MRTDEGTQSFYLEHSDDILCLNLHPDKLIVASGEVGKCPKILIWNSATRETIKSLTAPDGHTHGISALNFSPCGKKLLSVGSDPKNLVGIWDWERDSLISLISGHTDKIFDCCFFPGKDSSFITVGIKVCAQYM